MGALIVYGEHLSNCANIWKSRHRNFTSQNYLNLEVYNWFFPSAKKTQSETFSLSLWPRLNELYYYFCHFGSAQEGNQ